jgi:hypothetical protein
MGEGERSGSIAKQAGGAQSQANIQIRLKRFHLPPVDTAVIVGRRAMIGATAMLKSLEQMLPGAFRLVEVDDPVAEAIIVREAHVRRIDPERLAQLILDAAEGAMGETEMMHVTVDVEIRYSTSMEL